MSTRNRWLLAGLAAVVMVVSAGAAPTVQYLRQRRAAAIQELKLRIVNQAWRGAIRGGEGVLWDDQPLALGTEITEDQLEQREDEVQSEADPLIRDAARLHWKQPDGRLVQMRLDEDQRWANADLEPADQLPWVNLGPTNARFQSNGGPYNQRDSGRATFIHSDPRDPKVIYHATATGGIWKTYDATADTPTWVPVTENVNGSIGAFDIARSSPDTIYIAVGDVYDTTEGGQILKSTDGGGTWTVMNNGVALTGHYPPEITVPPTPGGRTERATQMRDIKVSPDDPNMVLVGSEVGMFRSTNGGATFSLVQMPTLPDRMFHKEYNISSIVYIGSASGQSYWVAAGQPACGTDVFPFPPRRFSYGQAAGTADCMDGNQSHFWKSTDSGATWRLVNAGIDYGTEAAYIQMWTGLGRTNLAVSNTINPSQTVIYGWAEPNDEIGFVQHPSQPGLLAILKSVDGGEHWTVPATGRSPVNYSVGNCSTLDVGHQQGWYNQMIAVDPANSNNIIIGGNFCGARSRDGGRTWDNVAHWLPHAGGGTVDPNHRLNYVHADWHAGLIVHIGPKTYTFAGTDGGFFRTDNLFTIDDPTNARQDGVFRTCEENPPCTGVNWTAATNKGITTHQCYSIGSGDPALGDEFTAFCGLQDNGTRLRDDGTETGYPFDPTRFNQVVGGDGVASIVAYVTATSPPTARRYLFGALPDGPRVACRTNMTGPNTCNCRDGDTACQQGLGGWNNVGIPSGTGDSDPFFVKFALLPRTSDTGSDQVLTATNFRAIRIYYTGTALAARVLSEWTNPTTPGSFYINGANQGIRNIHASPRVYSDAEGNFRLIGVSLASGWYSVGIDRSPDDATVSVTWVNTTTRLGIGPAANQRLLGTTSVAFPSSANNLHAGSVDGTAFLVSSNAARMVDNITPVPDNIGHLFKTVDGGATWTTFHGNGTGFDLPNVPVEQVVFDPGDSTDQKIYVLTDIGLYLSRDQGATWRRFGVGFPNAAADMIFISRNGSLIRVGSYGRGIWEIYPNAASARGVRGNGDWDRNQQIDFLDLQAVAARIGTTPETSTPPLYEANLAQGDTNQITEADLTAILNKFGNHP